MKAILSLIAVLLCCQMAFSQSFKVPNLISGVYQSTGCNWDDSLNIISAIEYLEGLDTQKISTGMDAYYYDLGMAYYKAKFYTKIDNPYPKAMAAFKKCIQYNEGTYYKSSVVNLIVISFISNNCQQAAYYYKQGKIQAKTIKKTLGKDGFKQLKACAG